MVNYSDDTNLKFDLAGMELQKRVKPMLLLAEDWIDCRLVFEYLKIPRTIFDDCTDSEYKV